MLQQFCSGRKSTHTHTHTHLVYLFREASSGMNDHLAVVFLRLLIFIFKGIPLDSLQRESVCAHTGMRTLI